MPSHRWRTDPRRRTESGANSHPNRRGANSGQGLRQSLTIPHPGSRGRAPGEPHSNRQGIDRATIDVLDADLASATDRLGTLRSLLASDPLLGLARAVPLTAVNVRGADGVIAAAGDLLDAVGEGLDIGRRFVEIREARAADPKEASALSQFVELMATSRDKAVDALAAVERARQTLAGVPDAGSRSRRSPACSRGRSPSRFGCRTATGSRQRARGSR